jgi:hypothetical protein
MRPAALSATAHNSALQNGQAQYLRWDERLAPLDSARLGGSLRGASTTTEAHVQQNLDHQVLGMHAVSRWLKERMVTIVTRRDAHKQRWPPLQIGTHGVAGRNQS